MTIDHRRPLIAFIGVTLLCAFVTVNGFLLVARSPMGGDLASARGLFSGFEGAEPPQLMPQVVDGARLLEEPVDEAPAGTTTEARVPAIDAIRDVARTAASSGDGSADSAGDGAVTAPTGAAGVSAARPGTGGSRQARTPGSGNEPKATAVRGRLGADQRSGRANTRDDGRPVAPRTSRPAPQPTDATSGNARRPATVEQGHSSRPGPKPDNSATPTRQAQAPATSQPAKPAKPAKKDLGKRSSGSANGSQGHSSRRTPPGHPKHDKASKPPKASQDKSSQGKANGKSAGKGKANGKSAGKGKDNGKPSGKAKGHGHK